MDALHADVVLPGSLTCKLGLKVTTDAGFLRRSRIKNHRHLTTVISQLLCLGVEGQDWGATAVAQMLKDPQSAKRAFKLRCWFGKDDMTNLLEHFIPYIRQVRCEARRWMGQRGVVWDGARCGARCVRGVGCGDGWERWETRGRR